MTPPDSHDAEVSLLLARYEEEPEHVTHVAFLAEALFTGLVLWHGRGERDRRLLRTAALLHDIGWSQTADGKGHHKESARLITEWTWTTLPAPEVALVAQIARYHRKSLPQPSHAPYMALAEADRRTVSVLGGILRIADALDRTHTRRIADVRAEVRPNALLLTAVPLPEADWKAERAMVERKKDLLELEAGRPVRIDGAEL